MIRRPNGRKGIKKMKRFYPLLIVPIFLMFIYYIINIDEIKEMEEVHSISHKKSVGLILNQKEEVQLENYIKDIAEIKIRGCTVGAKMLSIKCAFTDNVSKHALGRYNDTLNSIIWNEKHKLPEARYEWPEFKTDSNYKGLFAE